MDKLDRLLDQAMTEPAEPDGTMEGRVAAIGRLFALYREKDRMLARAYMQETLRIPQDKLEQAVTLIVQAHHWPRLPTVADVFAAARVAAGMHREQYQDDGARYVPAPREWPPEGKRHGIRVGEFESLSFAPALPEGLKQQALGEGEAPS